MTAYESVFILRPDLDEEAVAKTCDRIAALVADNGGTVLLLEKMGHRRLSYEVKGFTDGFYVVLNFEGGGATTRELERTFKISDEVIRYIIVRREVPLKAAPAKEASEGSKEGVEAPAPGTDGPAPAAGTGESGPVQKTQPVDTGAAAPSEPVAPADQPGGEPQS